MKYIDLQKQYQSIKNEVDEAVLAVLAKSDFILGESVVLLEKAIAGHTGVKFAAGVNSGTDALYLALRAFGVGPGDEVITTPFTFVATVEAIIQTGATPVFVDILPDTFNINADLIEKAINKKTKVILPVHLYGQMAEMDKIMRITKKYGLFVIEDVAQAQGGEYNGRRAGSFGNASCFSFFPSKNLGGGGDGGMVATNNKKIIEIVRKLRAHGSKKKYYHTRLGVNSRLDTIQAAILLVKMRYLDQWNEERIKRGQIYNRELSQNNQLIIPFVKNGVKHSYNQYTIRVKKRKSLQDFLKKNDIPTAIHYPIPLHLQPVFCCLGYKKGNFPMAEKTAKEVLSLPISPELLLIDQKYIIRKINDFYNLR